MPCELIWQVSTFFNQMPCNFNIKMQWHDKSYAVAENQFLQMPGIVVTFC